MGGAALAMALIVALMFRECSLARRTGDVTRACGAVRPEACGGRRGICPARSRVGDIHVRPLGGACPGDRERGGTHQSVRDCGWATTLFGMKFLGSVRGTLGPLGPTRSAPSRRLGGIPFPPGRPEPEGPEDLSVRVHTAV